MTVPYLGQAGLVAGSTSVPQWQAGGSRQSVPRLRWQLSHPSPPQQIIDHQYPHFIAMETAVQWKQACLTPKSPGSSAARPALGGQQTCASEGRSSFRTVSGRRTDGRFQQEVPFGLSLEKVSSGPFWREGGSPGGEAQKRGAEARSKLASSLAVWLGGRPAGCCTGAEEPRRARAWRRHGQAQALLGALGATETPDT